MARELIDLRDIESRLAAGLGQRLPWAGLAFAIGFTFGGEALARLIDADIGVGGGLAGVAVTCFIVGMALTRPLFRRRPYDISITSEGAAPCRWLVVAASGGAPGAGTPAGRAIDWQLDSKPSDLEQVYVLYTDNPIGLSFYKKVSGEAIASGLKPEQIHPVGLPPEARWNPDLVAPAIEEIFRDAAEAGLDEREVLVDYTGGSVAFTAAMTLVATPGRRRLAQIRPAVLADGQPDPSGDWRQMEVDIIYARRRLH